MPLLRSRLHLGPIVPLFGKFYLLGKSSNRAYNWVIFLFIQQVKFTKDETTEPYTYRGHYTTYVFTNTYMHRLEWCPLAFDARHYIPKRIHVTEKRGGGKEREGKK